MTIEFLYDTGLRNLNKIFRTSYRCKYKFRNIYDTMWLFFILLKSIIVTVTFEHDLKLTTASKCKLNIFYFSYLVILDWFKDLRSGTELTKVVLLKGVRTLHSIAVDDKIKLLAIFLANEICAGEVSQKLYWFVFY